MNTLTNLELTEAEVSGLHIALMLAADEVNSRLRIAQAGEIRFNVLNNQKQYIDALMTKTVRALDEINAATLK